MKEDRKEEESKVDEGILDIYNVEQHLLSDSIETPISSHQIDPNGENIHSSSNSSHVVTYSSGFGEKEYTDNIVGFKFD